MALRRKHINIDSSLLGVRAGNFPGWTSGIVAGHRTAISSVGSNLYPRSEGIDELFYPAAPTTISLASTSANDVNLGLGAWAVRVSGLDENYDKQSETVVLNGQTPVTLANTYIRITHLTVVQAGTSGHNEGTIYIASSSDTFTAGVPVEPYLSIAPAWNFQQGGVITVPNAHQIIAVSFGVMSGDFSNIDLTFEMRQNIGGFNYTPWVRMTQAQLAFSALSIDVAGLAPFNPKSDVRFRLRRTIGSTTVNTLVLLNYAERVV